jgi:hypothetical protein
VFVLQNVQTDSRANSGSCFSGTEVISSGTKRPVCVAAHFHLVACLRLGGALPLLPLYAVMSRTLVLRLLIYIKGCCEVVVLVHSSVLGEA